jgi:uncharacterized phage infection (PIP) family protein YhgE
MHAFYLVNNYRGTYGDFGPRDQGQGHGYHQARGDVHRSRSEHRRRHPDDEVQVVSSEDDGAAAKTVSYCDAANSGPPRKALRGMSHAEVSALIQQHLEDLTPSHEKNQPPPPQQQHRFNKKNQRQQQQQQSPSPQQPDALQILADTIVRSDSLMALHQKANNFEFRQNQHLQNLASDVNSIRDGAKADIHRINQDLVAFRKKTEDVERRFNDNGFEQHLDQVRGDAKEMKKQVELLTTDVKALKESSGFDDFVSATQANFEEVRNGLEEMRHASADHDKKFADSEKAATDINNQVQQLQDLGDSLKQDCKELSEAKDKLNKEVQKHKSTMHFIQKQMGELKKELSEASKEMMNLKKDLKEDKENSKGPINEEPASGDSNTSFRSCSPV